MFSEGGAHEESLCPQDLGLGNQSQELCRQQIETRVKGYER